MAGSGEFEHIGAHSQYDLEQLYDLKNSDDEPADSPFYNCANTYLTRYLNYFRRHLVILLSSVYTVRGYTFIGTLFKLAPRNNK